MCTFDSPIERCDLMHTMVITDQTQRQCAREHHCPRHTVCPLGDCFCGVDWKKTPSVPHTELTAAY